MRNKTRRILRAIFIPAAMLLTGCSVSPPIPNLGDEVVPYDAAFDAVSPGDVSPTTLAVGTGIGKRYPQFRDRGFHSIEDGVATIKASNPFDPKERWYLVDSSIFWSKDVDTKRRKHTDLISLAGGRIGVSNGAIITRRRWDTKGNPVFYVDVTNKWSYGSYYETIGGDANDTPFKVSDLAVRGEIASKTDARELAIVLNNSIGDMVREFNALAAEFEASKKRSSDAVDDFNLRMRTKAKEEKRERHYMILGEGTASILKAIHSDEKKAEEEAAAAKAKKEPEKRK